MAHVAAASGGGWVAHPWHTGHRPTPCVNGTRALETGCISAHVLAGAEIPALYNARPIMVQNDTHVFDLLELAPVVHGWVLLGEVERFVRVSRIRFQDVQFSSHSVHADPHFASPTGNRPSPQAMLHD